MGTHKSSANTSGDRKWKWLARGWLAVGLAVSAILFVRAMPHSPLRGSGQQAKPAAVATTFTSAQGTTASAGVPTGRTETVYVRRLITQPIETIRVGQRVLGTNPNRDEVEEFEEPDPKTWRTIEVEQIKPSGKKLYATLLRPLEWIEEELDPEANTIELDLPELGAEGEAKVLAIGPCPPIAPGNGHIVTATFKHEPDGELLTVTVGNDEIGCTANHPFWSEDRQEFVAAGQLREGERVRTRLEEVAAVVAIKPRPPTDWVYNLEVQGEHVYEVGPGGVLVHNGCAQQIGALRRLANRVHSFLDSFAQNRPTTVVLLTRDGRKIVAGGAKKDLTREQREYVRRLGHIAAKRVGSHAEPTALGRARQVGLDPYILVSTRRFCDRCRRYLENAGATIIDDFTAIWP